MLKERERQGAKTYGSSQKDSLANHICLATQIAYIIAHLEGANVSKCLEMAIFHDNSEIRVGDHDRIGKSYIKGLREAEIDALSDQTAVLGQEMSKRIVSLYKEKEEGITLEAKVVQDADFIEAALQAKRDFEKGHKDGKRWIERISEAVKTDSGKMITKAILNEEDFTGLWLKNR